MTLRTTYVQLRGEESRVLWTFSSGVCRCGHSGDNPRVLLSCLRRGWHRNRHASMAPWVSAFLATSNRKLHPTEIDTEVQLLCPSRYANQVVQTANGSAFFYDSLSTTEFL